MQAILSVNLFHFAVRFIEHSELAVSFGARDLMALSRREVCQQGFERKISGPMESWSLNIP